MISAKEKLLIRISSPVLINKSGSGKSEVDRRLENSSSLNLSVLFYDL